MPIDTIITLVKAVVTTAVTLHRILQEVNENEEEAQTIIDLLKSLQRRLEDQEKKISDQLIPEVLVQTDVLQRINTNFVEVEQKIQSVLNTIDQRRRSRFGRHGLRAYVLSADYKKAMSQAYQRLLDCQNRLEQHELISVTVNAVQEGFEGLQKRTPADFRVYESKIHQRFDELQQTLEISTRNHIPDDLNNRLIEIMNVLKKLSNYSMGKVGHENDDSTECNEIDYFGKLLDNISILSACEWDSPAANALIKRITEWVNETWRIDESLFDYDKDKKGCNVRIANGTTGIVYRGTYKETNKSEKIPVAIKDVPICESSNIKKHCAELLRQTMIHKYLDHPCIVKLYGVVWPAEVKINGEKVDPNDDNENYKASFIMEKMKYNLEGGLKRLMKRREKVQVLCDTSEAVAYLHSKNIVHRDLKAQNVLLNLDDGSILEGKAKLCDFGISKQRHDERNNPLKLSGNTISKGTPLYRPPETFDHYEYTKPSWDVWSFGILMAVTLVDNVRVQPSFDISKMSELVRSGEFQTQIMKWIAKIRDEPLRDLATSCLEKEEQRRPKMSTVNEKLKEIYATL